MRLINNILPFTYFLPRFLFGFHITHVIKGRVLLERTRIGKNSARGPFLMDCSRLSSIAGEGKKRGFIWFLLFSWLASLGLLLVFLIRECHWIKRSLLSAMRQLPAQRMNVLKIWRDQGVVLVAVDG